MITKSPLCIRARVTEQVVEKTHIFNRNGGLHSFVCVSIPLAAYYTYYLYIQFIPLPRRISQTRALTHGNTRNMLHKKCKTYCFLAGYCLCSCVNSSHAIVCIAFVFRYVHRNRIPIGVYNLVCNK